MYKFVLIILLGVCGMALSYLASVSGLDNNKSELLIISLMASRRSLVSVAFIGGLVTS